jgi:hypothetical protein
MLRRLTSARRESGLAAKPGLNTLLLLCDIVRCLTGDLTSDVKDIILGSEAMDCWSLPIENSGDVGTFAPAVCAKEYCNCRGSDGEDAVRFAKVALLCAAADGSSSVLNLLMAPIVADEALERRGWLCDGWAFEDTTCDS